MPFKGPEPYGVGRENDDMTIPQYPPDVRVAEGGGYIAYLLVNGPITVRRRDQIEAVIRTLASRGQDAKGRVMAIIVRDGGTVIEQDMSDLEARAEGVKLESIAPGIVKILIPTKGITGPMLGEAIVQATHIGDKQITTPKIADGAVTNKQILNDAVTTEKIGANEVKERNISAGAVTPGKLDRTYLSSVPTIQTANIANQAVTPGKLDRSYLTSLPAHSHSLPISVDSASVATGTYGEGTSVITVSNASVDTSPSAFVIGTGFIVLSSGAGTLSVQRQRDGGTWLSPVQIAYRVPSNTTLAIPLSFAEEVSATITNYRVTLNVTSSTTVVRGLMQMLSVKKTTA